MKKQIVDMTETYTHDGDVLYMESKGLGDGKVVGSVMTATGSAIAAIPIPPFPQIVGGIIAGAGALISTFSNGNAARKASQEAGQYDASNLALQSQNAQLDAKITALQSALIDAKQHLGLSGVQGLGWCLINCAKTQAQAHLKSAKDLFDELTKDQNTRIQILEQLTAEAERIFLKQRTINFFYIGTGVLVAGALVYLIAKKSKS